MVRIRALVPLWHPGTQEELTAGAEADVAEEVARAWQAAGKISLISVEEASMQTAGHYTDVTGREDVAPLVPGGSPPGPQAEREQDDEEQA